MSRRYSQSEVEEILRRALRATERPDEVDHADLVAAAGEVGIEPAVLDEAVRALDHARAKDSLETRVVARKRRGFGHSVFAFVVVNGILTALDLATGDGLWVHYVALIWALPLLFQLRRAFFPSEDELERDVEKERKRDERRQRRLLKEQRKKALRASHVELESAIEAGVELFVDAIRHRRSAQDPNRARGGAPPRVRVDPRREVEEGVTIEPREIGRRSR